MASRFGAPCKVLRPPVLVKHRGANSSSPRRVIFLCSCLRYPTLRSSSTASSMPARLPALVRAFCAWLALLTSCS